MAKQQKAACVDLCGVYAAPHPQAQETNILNIEDVAKFGSFTSKQAI